EPTFPSGGRKGRGDKAVRRRVRRPEEADQREPLRQALQRVRREAPPRRVHQDLRPGARAPPRREEELSLVRVSLPPDFSFDGVVRSHGWYDLPPFEYDREGGALRTAVDSGARAIPVSFRARGGRLIAEAEGLDVARLRKIARRVFSLDVDLGVFAREIAGEPELVQGLAQGRGRMLRAPTLFEDAVKMLLTTNCSWAATRGMVVRLIAELGAEGRAFPNAAPIAAMTPSRLKAKIRCGYRAVSLVRFARRVARGELDLGAWERREIPAEEIRGAITSEHGFGPYAAEGLLRIL